MHQTNDVIVTFVEHSQIERTIRVAADVILEPGSPAVWFTFPGVGHDIGRFHTRDGHFTGLYANVITPVHFLDARTWETTDLFLDVWFGASTDVPIVLDEDEWQDALNRKWIGAERAEAAQREVTRIIEAHAAGAWPPPVVHTWTLERARAIVGE